MKKLQTKITYSLTLTLALSGLLGLILMTQTKRVKAATTYTVASTADHGSGSLREAMTNANNTPGADIINLTATGAIVLETELPEITDDLTINGPGANRLSVERSTADGTPNFRIFMINSGKTVTVSGLTIAKGNLAALGSGGGIFNQGRLTLNNCTVSGNSAFSAGGIASVADASASTVTLTINNSTISGNFSGGHESMASSGASNFGTGSGHTEVVTIEYLVTSGGAVNNSCLGSGHTATLTINNSTISGNTISGAGVGGGIGNTCSDSTCTLMINNSTISGNSAGGISSNGTAMIGGSIIARNSADDGPDVSGPFTSLGYNLIGKNDGSTGFTNGVNHDQVGSSAAPLDPKFELDPNGKPLLKDNGGPTKTIALLLGSPAINAGNNTGAPDKDQRGIARPQQGTVDIGAFESRGFILAVTSGNNQSAQINTAFTNPLAVTASSNFGEPVGSGPITFAATGSGANAALSGTPATIQANGQASITATANGKPGSYLVTASANGASSACFNLTNLCQPITVNPTTTTLTPGTVGTSYAQQFSQSSGNGTITWSINSPVPGLTLDSTGKLSGTPTQSGVYNITIQAKDVNQCPGSRTFQLTINCPTITLNPAASLATGTVGSPYNQSIVPLGGTAPFTFDVTGLPNGVTKSVSTTGITLGGMPTQAGSFNVPVTATDYYHCASASTTYTLVVYCPQITLDQATLVAGKFGTAYSQIITPSGGAAPYTFNAAGLPAGLALNATATNVTLSGIPRQAGSFTVTVTATDVYGCLGSRTYTLNLGVPGDVRFSADYDGDGKADLAIWRPATATFWIYASATGSMVTKQLGTSTDIPVPGDYDGDGKTDCAVWRPSTATFTIINSSNGATVTGQWGAPGDVPVPGNYDGDGKTDYAVWRPSTGAWWIFRSSNNSTMTAQWGTLGDVPVPNDYDGDGKTDLAVWRPATATFWIYNSATSNMTTKQWGNATDVAVPSDYDGDGKADVAVWRPATATFLVCNSSNGATVTGQWGSATDIPTPGDYDGDHKTDYAVWRPSNGMWFVNRSSNGTMMTTQWGTLGDVPVS